jgi:hypothetical protein
VIDLAQTKVRVRQHFFKFLESLVKKLGFLKRGDSQWKTNSSDCKNLQHGGGKFLSKFWSYIYLLLLKISRIFLFRISAARINLCPCSYFAVSKIPRDYSYYAAHQLCLAGRCEQAQKRSALLRYEYKFCGRQAANSGKSVEPLLHRERPRIKSRSFLTILKI